MTTAAKFPGLPEAVPWSLLRATHIPLYRKEFGSELKLPSRAQWPTLKLGRGACVLGTGVAGVSEPLW